MLHVVLRIAAVLKRQPVRNHVRSSFICRRVPSAYRTSARSLIMSSGLLTPLIVGLSGLGLYPWHHSKPPLTGPLLEYSRYDPNFTIVCLMAINSAVFLMWRLGRRGAEVDLGRPVTKRILEANKHLYPADVRTLSEKRRFWLGQFMRRHFMSSNARTFSRNGWHTAVTSMFSHQSWFHFLLNMSILWLIGGGVHEIVGREAFLGIFLGTFKHWYGRTVPYVSFNHEW